MKPMIVWVSLAFLLLSFPAKAESGYKSTDEKLKVYRTYYSIPMVEKDLSYLFHAWMVTEGPQKVTVFCKIVIKPGEEESLFEFINSPLNQCTVDEKTPVPAKLNPPTEGVAKKLDGEIRKAILEKFGGEKPLPVHMDFKGLFRVVHVEGRTRVSTGITKEGPLVKLNWHRYLIDQDLTSLSYFSPAGAEIARRSDLLECYREKFGLKCDGAPDFIDFVMPSELEGSSLIRLINVPGHVKSAVARRAYAELNKAITTTVVALQNKTYRNPLDDILRWQGETLLREGFNQYVEIRVFAMEAPTFQSGTGTTFTFPIGEAYGKTYSAERKIDLAIFAVSLDIRRETFELLVKDTNGKVVGKANWIFDRDTTAKFSENLIEDGPRAAIPTSIVLRDPRNPTKGAPAILVKLKGVDYKVSIDSLEATDVTAPPEP